MSWEAWAAKMADNEMLASLESETLVYLAMPSLRAKSFPQEIWADRFLEEAEGGGMRDAAIRAAHRSFMLMERYRARRVISRNVARLGHCRFRFLVTMSHASFGEGACAFLDVCMLGGGIGRGTLQRGNCAD